MFRSHDSAPDPAPSPGARRSPADTSADAANTSRRAVSVVVGWDEGERVATKCGTSRAGIVALEREALILSQLHHPNVVDLVRTRRSSGSFSLTTRFAGETTLASLVPTDAAEVARLAVALLTVVDDLHGMGWCHGRLRAEHCLLGEDGRLTLCALGAAHRVETGDPRRSRDRADAVAIVSALAARIEPPRSYQERRNERVLRAALAGVGVTPPSPASWQRLRRRLDDLCGTASPRRRRGTGHDTTRPSRRSAHEARHEATTQPRRHRHHRLRGVLASTSALVGLLATIWFLRWVGGPLGITDDAGVPRVGDLPQPVRLALEIVRVVALAACIYGIGLASTTLAAVLTRRPDVARLATAMAPPRLRTWLVALIGVGVLSSVATGPASGAPSAAGRSSGPAATAPTTTTTVLPTTTVVPMPELAPPPAPAPTPDERPPEPGLPNLWVMAPGDHLWGVSEQALSAHLGRPATDAEIDGYWRRVIDLNRDSLLDPDEPDLVFSGQVIELPPFD